MYNWYLSKSCLQMHWWPLMPSHQQAHCRITTNKCILYVFSITACITFFRFFKIRWHISDWLPRSRVTWQQVNTLGSRKNDCHDAIEIFKFISCAVVILYFESNVTEICSLWSNYKPAGMHCIDSDNGMAPSKRQAIIWINDDIIYWCIYMRHSASMS